MDLWIECLMLTEEEYWLVEEQKEEKNYPFQMNFVTKSNF